MHVHMYKVQGIVFILKIIIKTSTYLDIFCYKAVVMFTSMYA